MKNLAIRFLMACMVIFLVVGLLPSTSFAQAVDVRGAGSTRTLSNIAYIHGNRAGLQMDHAWTVSDVTYRVATFPLSKNEGSGNLEAVVAGTMSDWSVCNERNNGLQCRIMMGCEEDETAFTHADSGQASARGGLAASRCGAAVDMMITRNSDVRHSLRTSYLGTSRGGVDDESSRHVELWVLPPDVDVDFAGMGYRPAVNEWEAAKRLEELYSARNAPDTNMFISGYLLNLQEKKPQSWVRIPRFGMPSTGSFPMPDQCMIEMDQPMSRATVAAAVSSGTMPSGYGSSSPVIAQYVRERWSQIGHCPTWATAEKSQVIWDLSTNVCRDPEHDEDGIITIGGLVELEIALRKEKEGQFDSEGFARHLVMLDGQDGFSVAGDLMQDGYLQVDFVGLCGIDVWNRKVQMEKARIAQLAAEEAAFAAKMARIEEWYNKKVRFHVAFELMLGGDFLIEENNPYGAQVGFVGGGMVAPGLSFGNDRRRLVAKGLVVPHWHGGAEFYNYAPGGLGAGAALGYQGGFRGDVGGEITGGWFHTFTAWTDAGGDRTDSLDDTMFTQFLLRVHPRQDLLGRVGAQEVYRTGAHTGAFVIGLHTAVMMRSGMEPGSLMVMPQIKGVIGWEW